eukprot:CAMPEP_0194368600 /NCGR_PEP_ID=MMETSP0174-20130528/16793_1 /TAXON_ID=216777 /ORGANISM="Proboscia alata, Strain PI-D3" /LENGTH=385 /DNA_ID=CAMNT_0039145013 /DNA_START=101 /DNA_END=1258 /DNA_ORIENTATION=-
MMSSRFLSRCFQIPSSTVRRVAQHQLVTSASYTTSSIPPQKVGHSGHLSAETLRNQHDVPEPQGAPGITHAQKYLFDLNGYIVLKNVFSLAEVQSANEAVDHHTPTEMHERKSQLRTSGLYGRESKALAGDGNTGRFDMGGMLGWDSPHNSTFRRVLAHPTLAPILNELLGVGYRLDHSPLLIAQEQGSEGHTLHGGAITEAGEPAWPLAYEFRHGRMRNQLLTVCLQLTPANAGDGGFCAVPGSHKSNYSIPPALADLADEELAQVVRQPVAMPGDVLIFSEATLHGTLPWTAAHQRRTVIYRFAPAGSAYGRGYLAANRGAEALWPETTLEGMTEDQRAVMLPPYHPRMNRPYLDGEGQVVKAKAREPFKVEFDEKVFGTRYF